MFSGQIERKKNHNYLKVSSKIWELLVLQLPV